MDGQRENRGTSQSDQRASAPQVFGIVRQCFEPDRSGGDVFGSAGADSPQTNRRRPDGGIRRNRNRESDSEPPHPIPLPRWGRGEPQRRCDRLRPKWTAERRVPIPAMELKFVLEAILFSAQQPLSGKALRDLLVQAAGPSEEPAT